MVSEQNYSTRKFFTENLLLIEMKKTQLLMSKPVYSELLILDQRKTAMCEFWYVFVKPNMVEKQNCVVWIQIASLFM